jgi:hypothetical protein
MRRFQAQTERKSQKKMSYLLNIKWRVVLKYGLTNTQIGTPNGIRIHVGGVKGRCPRPLDDGGTPLTVYQTSADLTTFSSVTAIAPPILTD